MDHGAAMRSAGPCGTSSGVADDEMDQIIEIWHGTRGARSMRERGPFARLAIDRRRLIVAAAGAGLVLRVGGAATLAQTATAPADPSAIPTGAVAWLKYNLNSASSEQLQGIPRAGDRMTREFEEYRPYTSIGQFRAELGKYISPEEVAAFAAYLFVPVDVNQADADTMQQLPGLTPDAVQALTASRPYADPNAFLTALDEHVAPELAAAAKTLLAPDAAGTATWIKYNLNTASTEQLQAIPGAGERMTREFEEYRPYTSIGQFRAELGKYISPEEVAGFEKYLFVPVDPTQADRDTLQQLPGVSADIAQSLAGAVPYASIEAFLTALRDKIAPELAALAQTYLVAA
jgi:DNA uptake protein ComE-like DNA-binding protein